MLRKAENREEWRKLVAKSQWCPNVQPDYRIDKIRTQFLTAAENVRSQQLCLVLISVHTTTILTHKESLPFEAVVRRHRMYAVDVSGTLWKLDDRQERADHSACNSVPCTPTGKRSLISDGNRNILGLDRNSSLRLWFM